MPTAVGTPSSQYQTSSASNTFSHTVPATGARRALRVYVGAFNGGGGSITGVTYSGVSMTKVGSTYGSMAAGLCEQYILVNPATGANNVVISASGSLSEIMGIASSWEDVDQTTPTTGSTGNTGTGTAPSISLTVTGSNVGVAGTQFFSANTDNPAQSDTLIAELAASASSSGYSDQYGDGSLSWTFGFSSDYVALGFVLVHDGGSAGSHTTSGALSAQAATVAGSATHLTLHTSTGALNAQASVVAGSAAHPSSTPGPRVFTNLGAPFGAGSFESYIIGSASAGGGFSTSGALSAQDATVAGTAVHRTLHATTGALSAQAATIAGTAQHRHAATGALSAQSATLAGTATHFTLHASTGALSAQASAISGAAQHQHATSGALAAQAATIAGSADHTAAGASHGTSGALAAQDATIAGSAAHLTLHTTTGALAAQASTVSGTAAHQHASTGALAAQAATVSGTATHLTLHATSGALSSQAATISGAAAKNHAASGALSAQSATVAGDASRSAAGIHTTTGALQAGDASISGDATGPALAGFPGFEVDTEPTLWWKKRKPEPTGAVSAKSAEQPKRQNKPSPEIKAQVRAAIAEAAKSQVERGPVPKSARFAEIRGILKPFGVNADFNWPKLYDSLYQQALSDALRQEMELENQILAQQQMLDDDALALLLLEM